MGYDDKLKGIFMAITTAKKDDINTSKVNNFNFAPDRISFRVIANIDCDMSDFEEFVKAFENEFTDLKVTLSEETKTHKWFAFNIQSETYIKFKRVRDIINFLENTVVIDDDLEMKTEEVYF
jgi:hypothetical protein